MVMKKCIALLVLFSFTISGCASMFNGTKETIHVRSEETDTVFFVNERQIGKGSSAVTTLDKKGLSSVVIRAEKKGCNTKSQPVETKFDGVSLLGILIDLGIFSILVIDWGINGATTRAAQNDYILTPECTIGSISPVNQVNPGK
jgi:hypothetical protein